jgi:excisionase family DNA binding protein|tara:strand:- start:44 stop:262 length:219 start_codon:yes stop_codon:yes gene_type:complete
MNGTRTDTAEPLLLRAPEVAALLRIGRTKVYTMMASGELPVVRLGNALRVPKQALVEWISRRTGEKVSVDDV